MPQNAFSSTLRHPSQIALLCAILLTGCASSGGGTASGGNAAPTFAQGAPAASDVLPPLPRPDDEQLAALLQQVNIDYRRWLANPAGYVTSPAVPRAWPCDVPQAERERLAGIPDPRDPKLRAFYADQERALGLKRGSRKPNEVDKLRIELLKGECLAGKLQGEVELLAEYESVSFWPGNEVRTAKRVWSRFNTNAGKPVGPTFRASFTGAQRQSARTQGTGTVVGATFTLTQPTTPQRAATISYDRSETPKAPFGSLVFLTQGVTLSQPLGGDRWKTVSYSGPTRISETLFKGDERHGKSINYAYEIASPFSSSPLKSPASEECFDRGEKIKSAACDVD